MQRDKQALAMAALGLGLLGISAISGCQGSWLHEVKRPVVPVALPETYAAPEAKAPRDKARSERDAAISSYTAFGDLALLKLQQQALAQNMGRKQAFARLLAAEAAAGGASASWWPSLSLNLQAGRSKRSIGPSSYESDSFSGSLAVNYELDLWGRLAATRAASQHSLEASVQDTQTVSIALAAQVAELWFQILEERERKALFLEQLAVNQTYLELVELRFGEGQVTALDVYQQRQQVSELAARLPLIERAERLLLNALSVLLGQAPGGLTIPAEARLPSAPEIAALQLPSSLLRTRPDLRAAEARVLAADHEVGAALAARFPTISLSASGGYQSTEIKSFFDHWVYNLAGNLIGPLFDGGQRAALQAQKEALLKERIFDYGQLVLTAIREVEDAKLKIESQGRVETDLEARLKLAESTLTEARSQYMSGVTSYLSVLSALKQRDALAQEALKARREALSYRVELIRAMGGHWGETLAPPRLDVEPQGDTHER